VSINHTGLSFHLDRLDESLHCFQMAGGTGKVTGPR
jgi:hypothetical protein